MAGAAFFIPGGGVDSNTDSDDYLAKDAEVTGQGFDCCPSSVTAGMPVYVAGDGDRAVPEQIGHRLDMHSSLQRGYGGAVPKRVHADVGHARLLRRDRDGAQNVARVDRRSELGRDHQPVFGPLVASRKSLGCLRCGWRKRNGQTPPRC